MSEDRSRLDRAMEWARLDRALAWARHRWSRDEPPAPYEDLAPPGAWEGHVPDELESPELPEGQAPDEAEALVPQIEGAIKLLRRGIRATPELKQGIRATLGLALALTAARLIIPILVQQILDKGLVGGYQPRFVYTACGVAVAVVVFVYFGGRATYVRLVRASEQALASLRVKAFAHIHELSVADQSAQKRGAFVARVTADIDILGQFLEWGALTWITSIALMVGAGVAMFVYSWQLAAIAIGVVAPLALILRLMQHAMLRAYDTIRTRVGETLSEVSESLMGAAVVRAYGMEDQTNRRVKGAIQRRYRAEIYGNRFQATMYPMADVFGALSIGSVILVGAWFGKRWGLSLGDLVAFAFLVQIFVQPLSDLSETFDQTQTAIAGWRKVLGLLDLPVEMYEPEPGLPLPDGALSVDADGVRFGYKDGEGLVLHGIDVSIPAGGHVAIVGETGCGKTTFAKLLCRLADPTGGTIELAGVDLRDVAPESRRTAIRMVPQDGFLFDATVRENVRYGKPNATDDQVEEALAELGLLEWAGTLSEGLETQVGERGESLSVGERQLVALARAQIASPGLLILDEATSAVDPETERAIGDALERLSEGRTTVTIAHRLSTAEAADSVLVFDRGRIVERGTHDQLVAAGGVYAGLYESWLGNTRASTVD